MDRTTSLGDATVTQVCRAFRLSRAAFYQAARPRRAVGEGRRRGRPPRGASHAELVAGIREVTAEHVAWGVRKVWATLRRRGVVASRKRVWAVMRELGLVLPPMSERDPEAPRGQVVTAESNRRWATDLTTVWTRRDGLVAVVPVVDCGDRSTLDVEVS